MLGMGVIIVLLVLVVIAEGIAVSIKNSLISQYEKQKDTLRTYSHLYYQWLKVSGIGERIEHYLKEKGYKTIAIYGLADAAELLCAQLKDSSIEVKYGIDMNAIEKNENDYPISFQIITPEELDDVVDAVIVAIPTSYESIKRALEKKVTCPVLDLEHIVYEIDE